MSGERCHFWGCVRPVREDDRAIRDPSARFCEDHAVEIDFYLIMEDTQKRVDFWVRASGLQVDPVR